MVETSQENKEVVFWSRSKNCRIANFSPEIREGGRIIQPEGSIRFFEHLYITKNPAEIKFIRESSTLENGDVRECPNITEANRLTAQHDAVKYSINEERAEHNESTVIQEGRVSR